MGNRPGSSIHKHKDRKTNKQLYSKFHLAIESPVTTENTLLETFLLVWLDPNVDTSKENIDTQRRLREILTCLITFDKVDTCKQWFEKCCSDEKVILIVSGAYGQEIVPKIHHLQSIITIYIYCLDIERNKIWAKNFSKIRSVTSSTNDLLRELSSNQTNLESIEDSKALKIYKHEQQVYSLDAKKSSFIAYQLLFEILISPNYIPSKGKFDEFIYILREYSSDDEYGSKLIDQFEQTYESKQAVSWLTRDTPLTRFVNKALRERDINMLFTLRFLLVDIHTQLIEHQIQSSLNVFKLQPMLKSEMEILKANSGQFVVINGFFFASTNMPKLLSTFTDNDQFETILFDIKADYRLGVSPFAFLRDIDSNIDEQIDREILFMCGSIFEVGPLIYENSIWTLQLKLISQNDSLILFNMKEKLKENQHLCIIGDLLNQSNQNEQATIFYQRLLNELPQRHTLVSQLNKRLSTNYSKSDLISTSNISFILVNLSEYMNEFTLEILNILRSLTSNLIFIIDNESSIDFSQYSKEQTLIFTTKQFASSLNELSKDFKIFLLDTSIENNINQQKFSTINELICQLVDEIIQMYRLKSNEYNKMGNLNKSKEQDKQINRIYRELEQLNDKQIKSNSSIKTSDNIVPILIWLISNTGNDEDNINYIKTNFKNYFSSYLTFYDENDFHLYLTKEENLADIFLIVYNNYRESIITGVRQFSNVKYVYRYDELKTNDEKIITDQNNLRYHIIYDLIDYYRKLGEQYRTNNQTKKAKDMFLQAKNLCSFLSIICFSEE